MRGEVLSHSTVAGKFGGREPLPYLLSQFSKSYAPGDAGQDGGGKKKKTEKQIFFYLALLEHTLRQ